MLTVQEGLCTATDSIIIHVNALPFAIASGTATICFGTDARLAASGGVLYHRAPPVFISDTSASNPLIIQPSNSITYTLTVTDVNGCQSNNIATATITVLPPPKVDAGRDTTIAIGQALTLNAADINNSGLVNYLWSPADGLNNPFIKNPVAVLNNNTTYTVTASTLQGCSASDAVNIVINRTADIFVPSAFSPAGVNRLLHAIPVGIKEFHYFVIYNRYREIVFRTANPAEGWDGNFRGKAQNSGGFVWVAEGVDYRNR